MKKQLISSINYLEKCEDTQAIEVLGTIAQLLKEQCNGSFKGATLNKEIKLNRLTIKILFGKYSND